MKSVGTVESVMGAAWGGKRLGIAWVSEHPNSGDESVGARVGWDC